MLRSKHALYDSPALTREHVEEWVKNGPSNDLIKQVDKFGEYIAKLLQKTPRKRKTNDDNKDIGKEENVTTSQIRQIFGKLKSIEAKGYDSTGMRTEFIMLICRW